ncbi:MAG TPA: response regulator [Candidatus Sulfotelmatobacter sp.]|jgi:PleD family two-component response regulator|nr:response regulator [Candidatus Sulfotelmatobacter sp.]
MSHQSVNSLTVLLVSSDRLFQAAAKVKLEGWGHRVLTADDETAASDLLENDPPRLAVVDMDMSDGAGARLCLLARSLAKAHPVYVLAYGSTEGRRGTLAALEAEADSYAVKPLHPGELQARVEQAARLLIQDEALFQGTGQDLPPGMVSREAFDRFYGILYAQFQRAGGAGVLLFTEWMNRGDIYHRYGFQAAYGTELEIARRLVTLHRSSDFVARLAEGRFCMLLTNTTSLQAHTVAMRVAGALHGLDLPYAESTGEEPLAPRLALSMCDFPVTDAHPRELLENRPLTPVAEFNGAE